MNAEDIRALGLKPWALAELCGVSHTTAESWLDGRASPRKQNVRKLYRVLAEMALATPEGRKLARMRGPKKRKKRETHRLKPIEMTPERIKAMRQRLGYSVIQVARYCGVDRGVV
jgi:DNA-binding transcriptional regulator YiaG